MSITQSCNCECFEWFLSKEISYSILFKSSFKEKYRQKKETVENESSRILATAANLIAAEVSDKIFQWNHIHPPMILSQHEFQTIYLCFCTF